MYGISRFGIGFKGKLEVNYLPTHQMLADALTKPLNGRMLRQLSEEMRIDFGSRNSACAKVAKGSEME
jgi:hypothetical protein